MPRRLLGTTALYVLSLVACGQRERRPAPGDHAGPGSARDRALSAAIARGDSVLAAGDTNEARMIFRVIAAFDSANVKARKRFTSLPDRGMVVSDEEARRANRVTLALPSEHWCDFPPRSDSIDVINIAMLSDVRLLPSLRSAGLRAQSGQCRAMDAFLMLGQPTATIAGVRERYGAPQAEVRNPDGTVVVTYGRFRIFGDKDGSVVAVILPGFA
jgi:hypothetical protein